MGEPHQAGRRMPFWACSHAEEGPTLMTHADGASIVATADVLASKPAAQYRRSKPF
jgi:hypothetical protein